MRLARNTKSKILTPNRIELLESIGFLWSGLKVGTKEMIPGGDPQQNRAMAAKLVWPDLTIREALHLGGYEEEELNAVRTTLHAPIRTWRTNYVYHKDIIIVVLQKFPLESRTQKRRKNIQKLVDVLEGDEEDRYEQVFGEFASLLPKYPEANEDRETNDIAETRMKRKRKKMQTTSDDEAAPARKHPHVESSNYDVDQPHMDC